MMSPRCRPAALAGPLSSRLITIAPRALAVADRMQAGAEIAARHMALFAQRRHSPLDRFIRHDQRPPTRPEQQHADQRALGVEHRTALETAAGIRLPD